MFHPEMRIHPVLSNAVLWPAPVRRGAPAHLLATLALLTMAACSRPPETQDTGSAHGSVREERRIEIGALGLVADVVQDDGLFYVLDSGQRQLAVVDPGSGVHQILGRTGRGPGEFVDPVGLATSSEKRIYLLDRGTQRLEIYGRQGGEITRTGSIPLDFVPEDLCGLGDRLFILGQRNGYLLHEVSVTSGKVLRSLVADPARGDPMLGAYYGSGLVQCGPGDQLTVLPLLRGEIVRYSATTGRPVNHMQIPGYRETRVSRAGGGIVYQAPSGGVADYASSLVGLGDGRLLVQIGPVPRGARRHEFSSLRSFLLSWRDHTLTELAPTLPRIVHIRGDTAVVVRTDPSPGVGLIPLVALSVSHSGT